MSNRADAARKLDETSFAIVEMRLFMDTHPGDAAAAAIRSKLENEYRVAWRNYVEVCGPLTIYDCDAMLWTDNPWPWDTEGCGC